MFIMVGSWLDKAKWDSADSALKVGMEVTVHGEKSGQAAARDSFWARVVTTPVDGSDEYEVENFDGVRSKVRRGVLRHRHAVQQAHVGITADPAHDSFSMRFFVGEFLKSLRSQHIIDEQGLRVLSVHSDNASQVVVDIFSATVPYRRKIFSPARY